MDNNLNIEELDIIDSTNDYLYRKNINGVNKNNNYLVIAKEQTNGHGSKNRTFLSKKDSGIYFSILTYNNNDILKLTANICVIIYREIKKNFNIELNIKWVNDLYYNNKKVCGILVKKYEDAIIIGIGIDLYKNNFLPDELKTTVGYIFEKNIDYNIIKKTIISIANEILKNINNNEILDEYFDKNIVYNKKVLINKNIYENSIVIKDKKNSNNNCFEKYECKIIDINKNGNLVVEDDNYIKLINTYDVEIIMR